MPDYIILPIVAASMLVSAYSAWVAYRIAHDARETLRVISKLAVEQLAHTLAKERMRE